MAKLTVSSLVRNTFSEVLDFIYLLLSWVDFTEQAAQSRFDPKCQKQNLQFTQKSAKSQLHSSL